jgi:hypothetical protein
MADLPPGIPELQRRLLRHHAAGAAKSADLRAEGPRAKALAADAAFGEQVRDKGALATLVVVADLAESCVSGGRYVSPLEAGALRGLVAEIRELIKAYEPALAAIDRRTNS